MSFTEFFIRRPAFTIVISLVVSIVGILSYLYLPIRWIPNISVPVVTTYTAYPGANAALVESQITTPLEEALSSVDGIDTISSSSKQGASFITIAFKRDKNINAAVEDVRSALQRISDGLPTGVKTPSVEKADPNGTPILFLAFSNPRMSAEEVSRYVKQFIVPRMQTVEGVATVVMFGERELAMNIWLDPMKMAASNVTIGDVNNAILEQNTSVPSGQIRSEKRLYNVITDVKLNSTHQFNELIIRDNQNQVVRIKDIGDAKLSAYNEDSAFRVNSQQAIAVGIIPQSTANPLEVSKHILKTFKDVNKNLPAGMQGNVVFNQGVFIQSSVDHVYQSLIEATLLVLGVIFLFLANWRAAFIPIVTIPVCLMSTFTILYICGFSINIITLMALVLAIGLVVDDAIVVLENIMRYIENGMSALTAAICGSREIVFSIIAMTLTLATVYAPIMFTPGLLGAVFKEFAATLAGAVLISGVIALTLSPMMCAQFLKKSNHAQGYQVWLDDWFKRLQNAYHQFLLKIFDKKRWVLVLLLIVGFCGALFYYFIPAELAPTEDMNEVDVYVSAPRDASFQFTDTYVKQLEEIYKTSPDIVSYLSQVGSWTPSKAFQLLNLKPQNQRKQTADHIAQQLNAKLKLITGVQAYVSAPPSPLAWMTDSGDGRSIEMEIMSTREYRDLHEITQSLIKKLQKKPIFTYLDSKLKWDGEQFEVHIDKEKAADMQIPIANITETISALLAGQTVGHFEYGNKQYDVRLQMNPNSLADPNIVSTFYVRSKNNQMVPLSGLITMNESVSPEMLPHFERLRSDKIYANLAPGYTMADAVNLLQKTAKEILPDDVKYDFTGEAHEYLESGGAMSFTFALAIIFIYLVLVAQFESFVDPFVILLTVPFAIIGALVTLKLTGGSLNIYSNIGLLTLVGLITKHGILITDFANRQRVAGKEIHDAVIEAAKLRLRPILMTTAAMMLGALPLAMSSGSGAETRQQIGWVVVGGLLVGTFFSLVVVPVAYVYIMRFKLIYFKR